MRQIPVQQDDITSLPAEDFNDIPREEENLITSGGIALDDGDLFQMAKAVANYSATGDSYTDIGSANLYSLTPQSSFKGITAYDVGTKVRFKVGNTNTNTACTVAVNGLAALPVHIGQLANGGTPSVPVGFLAENNIVQVTWDATPDAATEYLRIEQVTDAEIVSVSAGKLTEGTISITSSGTEWLQSATGGLSFGVSGNEFGEFTKDQIRLINNSSSANSMVSTITETTLTRNSIRMALSGRGCRYSVGPGEAGYKSVDVRKSEFAATVSWDFNSGSDPFLGFFTTTAIDLPDIPAGTIIHRVSIRYTVAGFPVTVQVYEKHTDNASIRRIVKIVANTGGETPDSAIIVLVEYDGSGL